MSIDAEYAEVCHPPTISVMGRRLLPLTLGHAVLLTTPAVNCRLLWWNHDEADDTDVLQVVRVCSRSWQQAKRMLNRRLAGLGLRYMDWVWRRGHTAEQRLIMRARVVRYINTNLRRPNTKVDQKRSGGLHGASLAFWATWCMERGQTCDEAMDEPLRRLLWNIDHQQARDGALTIRTDRTETFDEYTRRVMLEDEEEARAASGMPVEWKRKYV